MDPLCVVCSRPVTDSCPAVGCDHCENWQHVPCDTGLTLAQYGEMVRDNLELPFKCAACNDKTNELSDFEFRTEVDSNESSDEMDIDADQTPNDEESANHMTVEENLDESSNQYSSDELTDINEASHHVDRSFQEPVVIHERSLADPPCCDELTEPTSISYEVQRGASQRGHDLLVDSVGYCYNVKKRNQNGTLWQCSVRNNRVTCPARVRQAGEKYDRNDKEHVHAPDPSKKATLLIKMKAIVAGRKDVFKSALQLSETIARQVAADIRPLQKPNTNYISRIVNRKRKNDRPQEPEGLDFHLQEEHLPEGFFRQDVRVQGKRHLIFASDEQLTILKSAQRWYLDGTFKIVRRPFDQLWGVHAFVRRGDQATQIPLVYVLMSGRRTVDYVKVLQAIGRLCQRDVQVVEFVADFERAVWRALRTVFPGASIKGCQFHWGNAVMKQIQKKGLVPDYLEKKGEYEFLRKVLALPFLPAEHIQETFDWLCERFGKPNHAAFLEYVRRNWLESTTFPVESWSVFGQVIRTNNDCEGYHHRLNRRATNGAPPFYTTTRILADEAATAVYNVELVSDLRLRKYQRKRVKSSAKETLKYWKLYRAGEISSTSLLKAMANVHRVRVPVVTELD